MSSLLLSVSFLWCKNRHFSKTGCTAEQRKFYFDKSNQNVIIPARDFILCQEAKKHSLRTSWELYQLVSALMSHPAGHLYQTWLIRHTWQSGTIYS